MTPLHTGIACPRAPTTPHDTCLSTRFATGCTCVHPNVGLSYASRGGLPLMHQQPDHTSHSALLHTLRNRMRLPTPHEGAACPLAPTTIMTPASPHASQPDALAYTSRGGCVSTRTDNHHDTCVSTRFATGYACVHLNVGACHAPQQHLMTPASPYASQPDALAYTSTWGLRVHSHQQPS